MSPTGLSGFTSFGRHQFRPLLREFIVQKPVINGPVQGLGVERQKILCPAVPRQRRLHQKQMVRIIAQQNAARTRQILLHERCVFLEGIVVRIPDLRRVSVNQPGHCCHGEQPNASDHQGIQKLKRFRPGWLQTAAGGFAKNEQKISAEITDAQCAQIIKRQERCSKTEMPRAERRIKGHPNADDQKGGVHQMKHETGQRQAHGAVIAKGRFPADRQHEQRHQVGQQQRQEFKILLMGGGSRRNRISAHHTAAPG